MNLKIFEDYNKLSHFIAANIREYVNKKPDSLICIAAGNTSLGLFRELIKMDAGGEIDFSHCRFVAMDEWLNMNITTKNSCSSFLYENFFRHIKVPESSIRYVDGKAEDIDKECRDIKDYIESFGGIDYLVLGSGMNGHLALNEPGIDFSSTVHKTMLDPVTQKVGQKYFETPAELTGGITIGIKEICDSKRVVLAVNSSSKCQILKDIIYNDITNKIPATVVKQIAGSIIACDMDAAAFLGEDMITPLSD